jgi:hypothetical protein
MLHGDFQAGAVDSDWQLIPTEWIQAAMDRWEPRDVPGKLSAIGCDPARGGADSTVISCRYGWWFDKLSVHALTPSGGDVAGLILQKMGADVGVPINLDIIGIGASVFDHLQSFNCNVTGVNNASKSEKRDITGSIGFVNKRADTWWQLRELLSPESSAQLSLPPDRELMADLATPMYSVGARGIQVESKTDIIKRLGHSPDRGDALVLAAIRDIANHSVTPLSPRVVGLHIRGQPMGNRY